MNGEQGENGQQQKIKELTQEVERAKRNIKILIASSIILFCLIASLFSVQTFWKPASRWHEVVTFSGTFQDLDYETTNSFYIKNDHWRIVWSVDEGEPPLPNDLEFSVYVWTPWEDSSIQGFPAFWERSVAISSVDIHPRFGLISFGTEFFTGSGEYCFRIWGARVNWEITVEEYY